MKKTLTAILTFCLLLFMGVTLIMPVLSVAQTTCDENTGVTCDENLPPSSADIILKNPFAGGDDLVGFLTSILNNILIPIGGVLAVLAFIYSGFLYVTAQGNESKLQTANKALLYTAIGTAVLLGASVIAKLIAGTINQLQ